MTECNENEYITSHNLPKSYGFRSYINLEVHVMLAKGITMSTTVHDVVIDTGALMTILPYRLFKRLFTIEELHTKKSFDLKGIVKFDDIRCTKCNNIFNLQDIRCPKCNAPNTIPKAKAYQVDVEKLYLFDEFNKNIVFPKTSVWVTDYVKFTESILGRGFLSLLLQQYDDYRYCYYLRKGDLYYKIINNLQKQYADIIQPPEAIIKRYMHLL